MLIEFPQILEFLGRLSLFNSLDEYQIEKVAGLFRVDHRNVNDPILIQGRKAEAFFLILEGKALVEWQISKTESQTDIFIRGDFFGEDSLLQNEVERASITALTPLTLLRLEKTDFQRLVIEFPSIKDRLYRFVKSHQYMLTLHFNWLNDDEVIYQVRRRHIIHLLLSQLLPGLVVVIGLALAAFAWLTSSSVIIGDILLVVAAVIFGIGIGWSLWSWIDWGNDYYLVTNQRVVWIEKVIWLYESRIEAPLSTILSVNVGTSYLGRIFGFGNVIVTTYTGRILLETVSNPYQLSSLITEYWQRSQHEMEQTDHQEIQNSMRQMLGEPAEEPITNLPPGAKTKGGHRPPDEVREPSDWDKYFGNIFKLRIEDGKVITYRKHWLYLIRKTWMPAVISLGLLILIATFDIMYLLDRGWVTSPVLVTLLGGLVFVLALFPWWLYHYLDWRNDIYQVTDRSIFDIERKPFGTETRKSAPLDNILSLEHKRPGLLGYIFNVGVVTINVGEARISFENVFQPARVQQDIFNRMHALRMLKQKDEDARLRSRIMEMIEVYHEEVGGSN